MKDLIYLLIKQLFLAFIIYFFKINSD